MVYDILPDSIKENVTNIKTWVTIVIGILIVIGIMTLIYWFLVLKWDQRFEQLEIMNL